jgi:hypothetical protein
VGITIGPDGHMHQEVVSAMVKLAVALLLCPRNEHVTVPAPPLLLESMCRDHPTLLLLPGTSEAPQNGRPFTPHFALDFGQDRV